MPREAGTSRLVISGLDVEVVRRRGNKYLRVTVRPPDGKVRISAPVRTADRHLRETVEQHRGWIDQQIELIRAAPRPSVPQYVTGEEHYVSGVRCRLVVTERQGRSRVTFLDGSIHLEIADGSDVQARTMAVERWYRRRLEAQLGDLVDHWQVSVDARPASWGIRRMKTLWGSCNRTRRHLTFNLELAKKSPELVEYVVVHELVHLHEAGHGVRFKSLMDGHLPDWRDRRRALNASTPS